MEVIIERLMKLRIEIPMTPNFIRVNGFMQNLTFLTNDELKEISDNWYKQLISKKADQICYDKK